MKFTWEIKDIVCGRIVCKEAENYADGWAAKWTNKIGWLAKGNPSRPYLHSDLENRADYVLIALTDGMIGSYLTKKELVDYLNKEKMIPMPHKNLIQVMNYLENCYNS